MTEALGDPKHECHNEMRERARDDFHPHAFDAERLRDDVAVVAKR